MSIGKTGRKVKSTLVVSVFFALALMCFFVDNARAADDDLDVWGMIFDSDGNLLGYDTDFRVWVQHSGTWKGFPSNTTWDPVGTMGGFYSYRLPWDQKEINWTDGDQYRIQIDCTLSGDLAENATSNGTGSADDPISQRGSYNNELNWLTGGGLNNSQQWDVVCSNVDLIPTSIEIDGQPYSPPMRATPFSTVTFSAFVTNTGKTDIVEPNTIVLRNESGIIDQDTAVTIDSSTSAGPFSLLWNAPSSGYFCLNITVDFNDNVSEIDENNNSEMVCLSVGQADLTPSDIQITTNHGPEFYGDISLNSYRSDLIQITPGTTASIVANVKNVGTLSSGPCDLAFYNTTGGEGVPFYMPMMNPIDPGVSEGPFFANWSAPAVIDPKVFYVNITADYNGDVEEINELNNTFILRFLVGYPDYIPWNDALDLTQSVTSDTLIPLEVFVKNVGFLDALFPSTLAFYNQSDPLNPFESAIVPSIGTNGTSIAYNASWLAPTVATPTLYYVVIKVDYNSDIEEENELNNTLVIEFNVFPGPVTTLTYDTPFYFIGTNLYINSSTFLGFDVQSTATWAYTNYTLDGGAPVNYSLTGQFTISVEGLHDLVYYSFDSFGKEEAHHSQTIIVDDSPPETILNVTEPKYVDGLTGDIWVKSFQPATPIYLEWDREDEPDLAVGRQLTSYRVYNQAWGGWTEYIQGNPLDLGTGPGARQIEWFSLDHLGNNETIQSFTLYVDDTPPNGTVEIGEPNFEREQTRYVEKGTEFTLTFHDGSGCGIRSIEYRLDNELTWTEYGEPFKIDEFGEHTIHYRATDNLGNAFEDSQEVSVIGFNYKPLIGILFIIIMIMIGTAVGYKRPLLMARKRQRDVEDALLKEEEDLENVGESGEIGDVGSTSEEVV